jgi:hypothetical protein
MSRSLTPRSAQRLRHSAWYARKLVRRGRLPTVRRSSPGRLLFDPDQLEAAVRASAAAARGAGVADAARPRLA